MNITKYKDTKSDEKTYDHQDVEYQDADYYEDYVDTMETAKQENAMLKKQMAEMQEMIMQLKNQLQASQPCEKEKPAADEQLQQKEKKLSDNIRLDTTTGKYIITPPEDIEQQEKRDLNSIRENIKTKLKGIYVNKEGKDVFKYNTADVMTIIDLDPKLRNIKPRKNDMTLAIERADGKPYSQNDTTRIKMVLDDYGFYSEGHGKPIEEAVQLYAEQCSYNPLQDYLRNCRDRYKKGLRGKYTINEFFIRCLGGEDDKDGYTRAVTHSFFLNSVIIAMHPGTPVRNIPILGGDQGIGKTTVLRKLANDNKYFSDEVSDFDKNPRDTVITLNQTWIAEMGEGKVLKYKTAEDLKAFLTKYKYVYRPLYNRYNITVPRHTMFVITTNTVGDGLLNDSTGNTRYDIIQCKKANIDKAYDVNHLTQDDVAALWGEAMVELEAHPEYLKDGGMEYDDKIKDIQRVRNANYNFTAASWDVYDDWMSDNYNIVKVSAHQLFYLSDDDENKKWGDFSNKDKKDVSVYLSNRRDDAGNHCFTKCLAKATRINDVRGDGKTRMVRDAYDVTPEGRAYFEGLHKQQCMAAANGYMSKEDKNLQDQLKEMTDANFPDDKTE